jgi:predicted transcriptional regulator
MSLVSIRLPDDIEASLAREAERTQRPKSEIARDAIVQYLLRSERERFLADIARAARSRDGESSLVVAEEALPLANESLSLVEAPGVRERKTRYKVAKPQKNRKR